MQIDLDVSVRAGVRRLLLVCAAAGVLLPAVALAVEPAPAKPSDSAPAKAAQTAPAKAAEAAPAAPAGSSAVTYAPTGGAWRERLISARRKVLDATARLDEVNGEYARVLYEHSDDAQLVASHAAMRAQAKKQLSEARAAIPPMVEAARADGVSETVLDLYEKSTLNED